MNHPKPTRAEQERIGHMLQLGCVCCRIESVRYWNWVAASPEVHHILNGHRMGHAFTLPLCPGHHRGAWTDLQRQFWRTMNLSPASIAAGRKVFNKRYGTEYELYLVVQKDLMLPVAWPQSKIFKRAS
jgi:hypothetical protein